MSKKSKNERVLVISDLHAPAQHPDALNFLAKIKAKYKPDSVVSIGDLLDLHSVSQHDIDPSLPSPSDELKLGRGVIAKLASLFPDMHIIESNHDSRILRRALKSGIPDEFLISMHSVLGGHPGWSITRDLVLTLVTGRDVYFTHGKSNVPMKTSKNASTNSVEGHYHSAFQISYWGNHNALFWSAHCGCLADPKHRAMSYGSNSLSRPIIGTLMLIDGYPRLLPMVLDKSGRWNGVVL